MVELTNYPIYLHMFCQFALVPLSVVAPVWLFKTLFCVLLSKDYLFELNRMVHIHHFISLLGCLTLVDDESDTRMIGFAELGSVLYNLYVCGLFLGNPYISFVLYLVYASIMTASNLYCIFHIFRRAIERKKHSGWFVIPLLMLFILRQLHVIGHWKTHS